MHCAAVFLKADENYAREIMQLFSIGLFMLEPDGNMMVDSVGDPIPTYNIQDVEALARVFTGLAYYNEFTRYPGSGNDLAYEKPMVMYEEYHDQDMMSLLFLPIMVQGSEEI